MTGHRLVLLTKPMAHHGLRAGYNVLTRYLEPDHLLRVNATSAGRWVNGASRRLMRRWTGVEWYGAAGAWGEGRAAALGRWYSARDQRTVVHVMYGEDLLWALPRWTDPQTKVVATFHQPPERFDALVRRTEHLERLDGVIALDPSNAAALEPLSPGRVFTMTLGIDDQFWRPAPSPGPRDRRVLFVGNHLRDFAVLESTVRHFASRQVPFDLVVPARRQAEVSRWPNVRVFCGIPDEQLRDLYRQAAAFYLPLTGGSANNAVLQAMACGLPVVATDLPGVRSYVPADAGVFAAPGRAEAHIEALHRLLEDDALAVGAGRAAREQGRILGWRNVARRHRDLYERL
ncbi:MAG: glycosyltransferase family 4 protein [Myxococcota bacterium]